MGFVQKWLTSVVVIQLALFLLRYTTTGSTHAILHRATEVIFMQSAMILLSWLFYKYRLQPGFRALLTYSAQMRRYVRRLALAIVICAHTAYFTYYIYIIDDTWLVYFLFLCVSLYFHTIVLVFVFWLLFTFFDFVRGANHQPYIRAWRHTCSAVVIATLLTLHGFSVTQSSPKVVNVNIKLDRLASSLDDFSIALITDVHIGPTVSRLRVEEIVRLTNTLNADAIAISGDLIDAVIHRVKHKAEPLRHLHAKHGTFFATGNHEFFYEHGVGGVDTMIDYLRSLGIKPLQNAHALVGNGTDAICFAGVDDLHARALALKGHTMDAEKALAGCPENVANVLLVHQPNGAAIILDKVKRKIDLILSGHTHAGQFYIFKPVAYLQNAFFHGLYTEPKTKTQVYVSAGANYWGSPVKFRDGCEIIHIHLRSTSK